MDMRSTLQIITFISLAFASSLPLTFAQTPSDVQILLEIQERAKKRKDADPVGVVGGQWIGISGKNKPLRFFADGSVLSGSYRGSWSVVGQRSYSVRWPNGTTNRLTISDDGSTMTCVTKQGEKQDAPYHLRRSQ
jgi:hypothetical protein